LEEIPTLERKFDFAFIDPEKKQHFQYLKLVEDKQRKGAFILVDNMKVIAERRGNYLDYVHNSDNNL
jgi:predicted O-methyltransferase YrrM